MSADQARSIADSIESEVTLTLAEGLTASVWASESLMGDPAGIRFDNQGRVWVASTNRRRTSAPDAGAVSQWFHENLSWRSVSDREQFLFETLTPEASGENEWLPDFNEDGVHDWRDMTVERDPVYRVEDADGDGLAESAAVLDWDNYTAVTEITGSAFMHDGELFLARIPDLLRVRDRDGDGELDGAESLLHGFGVHYGYSGHGMSGFKLGPDGRLYAAIGDVGINVVDQEGQRWSIPHEGSIFRVDPDGSNFEVVARGLRNVHEFDFDAYGNLIAVDNNGPTGDVDRLVHLIDGSDSGWRIYWQMGKGADEKNNDYNPWVEEGYFKQPFDGQASHILPSIEPGYRGPAGLAYNPGTALGEAWTDTFFASSFVGATTQSGIQAFRLLPDGATFRRDTTVTVMRGILSTTLDFGPDGALYSGDWISGWVTKGTGRIWRFDTDERDESMRREVEQLIRSEASDWTLQELDVRLGHADRRIRQKAQEEWVKRGDTESLVRIARESEREMAQIHAVWALGQRGRQYQESVTDELISLLSVEHPEVQAQVAKTIGELGITDAADALAQQLNSDDPRVQLYTIEALGRLGDDGNLDAMAHLLRTWEGRELYLERATAIAWSRIGDVAFLTSLSKDTSRSVRAASLVALRRLGHEGVVAFLEDEDPALVLDAARAINDGEQIRAGLEPLSAKLEENLDDEALLRRAINASLYLGSEQAAHRLARFAMDSRPSVELRAEALETLAYWTNGSDLDRVTGRFRGVPDNDPSPARSAIADVAGTLLDPSGPVELRTRTLLAAGTLEVDLPADRLMEVLTTDPDSEVRLQALQAMDQIAGDRMEEALALVLNDPSSDVRMAALERLPRLSLDSDAQRSLLERVVTDGSLREQQTAVRLTGALDTSHGPDLLRRWVMEWREGRWPAELELDLLMAVESSGDEELNEQVSSILEQGDSVTDRYRWALYGGRADLGERVISNHQDAQCYRCHAAGGGAGPDLEAVGSRLDRVGLLEALVEPGATLTPGYGTVTLELRDGSTRQGFLQEKSDRHWVLQDDGREVEISVDEVTGVEYGMSSMPAMGEVLSREELRDVVEYLQNQNE